MDMAGLVRVKVTAAILCDDLQNGTIALCGSPSNQTLNSYDFFFIFYFILFIGGGVHIELKSSLLDLKHPL